MRNYNLFRIRGCLLYAIPFLICACSKGSQKWELNSLSNIGGKTMEIWGDPELVVLEGGEPAIEFDGTGDGILVDSNPLKGADELMIQVVLKPYGAYPENLEQTVLNIQDPKNGNKKLMLELILNNRHEWYPRFVMKAEDSMLSIADSTYTFPVNEWATMKMVYKDGRMTGLVDGKELLSGEALFLPIGNSGKTCIGSQIEQRSWFYGAIKSVEFAQNSSGILME